MPQLPPAPGVTRAVLQFRWDGQICNNVLHFIQEDGVNSPDPEELGSRLAAWYQTYLRSQASIAVTLEQIICTTLDANSSPGYITTAGLPIVGAVAGQALPNNCTLVISLRTNLRGRSFRGRIYHVGLAESQVDGNTVQSAIVSAMRTNYARLITMTGNTGEPVYNLAVLSYYTGNAVRATGLATEVVAVSSDGVIDSQRRRLPGRGR